LKTVKDAEPNLASENTSQKQMAHCLGVLIAERTGVIDLQTMALASLGGPEPPV
jgi:hypothetical protein